ncbi:MAG TPA: fatty acid CoA ligase family protein [Myxococcaceae bacterium]|nr:fatty acid CoA ligase family protein [Myxococcaceae bacterium]
METAPFVPGTLLSALRRRFPALSSMVGLMARKRDGSVSGAPINLLFSPDYGPFHDHRRRKEAEVPVTGSSAETNVAIMLQRAAERRPDTVALHLAATGGSVTFGALRERAGRVAAGLRRAGLAPGDRVLLMIRPGIDLAAAVFGALSMGAAAVVIDPGMGWRRMLDCVAAVKPRAMIAVRALHALRLLRPGAFRTVELAVSAGTFPGARSFERLVDEEPWMEVAPRAPDDPALISFTSGSTGEPKGVFQPHRVLQAQVRAFQAVFGAGPGDVLLAAFPALILLGPGLGCPVVLPEIDARRPAAFDPAKLAGTIRKYGTTASFGSPAIWGPLGRYCQEHDVSLPTMRCIAIGGAAVGLDLLDRFKGRMAPGAEPSTPYGATEAVPVTMVQADELRAGGGGPGILVGRPVEGVELRILEISDAPLREAAPLPAGVIGEIAVRGDMVAPGYFGRPDADALAKVPDEGGTWHRMGDLGFLDDRGRLWFCGRKSERVETGPGPLYTACVEPLFASDPRVRRVALVGVGARPDQKPVLVVEPAEGHWPRTARARRELAEAVLAGGASGPPAVRAIREVMFHRKLPLDIRHNSKVLRGELARWAARRLS